MKIYTVRCFSLIPPIGIDVRWESDASPSACCASRDPITLRGNCRMMQRIRYNAKLSNQHGRQVIEFNTHMTALSQTCLCEQKHKKWLSERVHTCECGVTMQRDLFSGRPRKKICQSLRQRMVYLWRK